jgi:cytochrome c oxidase subunit II
MFGLGIRLPGCLTTAKAFDKGSIVRRSDDVYEVHIVAKMWAFDPAEIKVEPNTTLEIYLASQDVTHGFNIENTNVNLMAVPGAINYAKVTLRKPGVYHIMCHEYCGAGHQNMSAKIVVGDGLELNAPPLTLSGNAAASDDLVAAGKTLFQSKGCIACHSPDGAGGVGPTFKGLFGRKEKLADGSIITIDEAYVTESVREPSLKLVSGFQALMPKLSVNDAELKQLISYLKTL